LDWLKLLLTVPIYYRCEPKNKLHIIITILGKQIDYLSEDLKAKDDHEATEKMIADSIVKFQTETLDTLSKRIDQNENHIKLLETKGPSISLPKKITIKFTLTICQYVVLFMVRYNW
jgi:hypothetical protein